MKVSRSDSETIVWLQGVAMLQRGKLVAKGQIVDGSINGKAIMKVVNEFWFKGEVKKDAFDGCGTMIAVMPESIGTSLPVVIPHRVVCSHQGGFKRGRRDGFGQVTWADGSILGYWNHDKAGGYAVVESSDQRFEGLVSGNIAVGKRTTAEGKYHGQFKQGKRDGVGILKTQSGYYIGQWEEDYSSGSGEELRQDGTKMQGEWLNGTLHGLACVSVTGSSLQKSEYVGSFENGQRSLFGRLEDSDSIYVGSWKQGLKHGRGLHKQPDGVTYFGDWKEDVRHGIGLSQAPGLKYIGEWIDDKPHGAGFITSGSRTNILAQFSQGVLVGQLPIEQAQGYHHQFAHLDLEEFQAQSSRTITSIQNKIQTKIESIKRAFKDLQLDFEAEQSSLQADKKLLKSSLLSLDQSISDIENFIDKRCEAVGVFPLKVSSNLSEENSIKFMKDPQQSLQSSNLNRSGVSRSPVQMRLPNEERLQNTSGIKQRVSESPGKQVVKNKKEKSSGVELKESGRSGTDAWKNARKSRTPEKSGIDMQAFARRMKTPKKAKDQEQEEEKLESGVDTRHKKVDPAKLKSKLLKQINQVDKQNSELKREQIQQRQARFVLEEMEEDIAKREKDLEKEKKKLNLEKLEIEELRLQVAMQAMRVKATPSEENEVRNGDANQIENFEASMRQKEILKQTEELVKQEQIKLDRIKRESREERQKLSEKKESLLKANAKKSVGIEKQTQVDNTHLPDDHSKQTNEKSVPSPVLTERPTTNLMSTPLTVSQIPVLSVAGAPKVTTSSAPNPSTSPSPASLSNPTKIPVLSKETQTDPLPSPAVESQKAASLPVSIKSESEEEDYFESLHRKTKLDPEALKGIEADTELDIDVLKVIRGGLPRMSKSHGIDIDLEKLIDIAKDTEEGKVDTNPKVSLSGNQTGDQGRKELEEQKRVAKEAEDRAKEAEKKAEDLAKEVKRLKATLDANNDQISGLQEKIKVYETPESLSTMANQANLATLGTSPYQSNATLVKKEQKANEQESVLEAVTEEHKRLELKAVYLEDQLSKARKKDQHLNKVIQDYTKELNKWLETLHDMESNNKGFSPEDLSQNITEIDIALNQAIPLTDQTVSTSKPPSSSLTVTKSTYQSWMYHFAII